MCPLQRKFVYLSAHDLNLTRIGDDTTLELGIKPGHQILASVLYRPSDEFTVSILTFIRFSATANQSSVAKMILPPTYKTGIQLCLAHCFQSSHGSLNLSSCMLCKNIIWLMRFVSKFSKVLFNLITC